ncbi:MAG: hypothetical protein RLZZ602_1130 [Pseudomonadota bacterium]
MTAEMAADRQTTWITLDPRTQPAADVVDAPFVHGYVAPGWESVAEVFAENFARGELGASCSVTQGGHRVVDLWGGQREPEGAPWGEQDLAVFFSCSKILATLVIHRLIADGLLALDTPLKNLWPELKAAQSGATLRMVLCHTIGLPALVKKLRSGAYNNHEYITGQLEQQEPFWEPGTRLGYHPITYGFLLGEIVRRATGKTLGRYFADQFAQPLGLDLYIGLPPSLFPRVAPIRAYALSREDAVKHVAVGSQTIGSIQNLWLFNSGGWRTDEINSAEGLKAEIPAASGVGNARSLDALLAIFNDTAKLDRLGFNEESIAGLESVASATQKDATLLCNSRFSLGMMKSIDNREDPCADSFIIGRRGFGHVGMGGSFGLCDREAGFSAAYVMNQQGHGILLNDRGQRLIDAMYRSAGFSRIRGGEWQP